VTPSGCHNVSKDEGIARILFLKSLAVERIFTYSDYHLEADGPYSASR